jgi:hypothetical protein
MRVCRFLGCGRKIILDYEYICFLTEFVDGVFVDLINQFEYKLYSFWL